MHPRTLSGSTYRDSESGNRSTPITRATGRSSRTTSRLHSATEGPSPDSRPACRSGRPFGPGANIDINTVPFHGRYDRPYLELQRARDVVEQNLAKVPAVGQMVPEVDLAPKRNMSAELVPPRETHPDGFSEGLPHEGQQRHPAGYTWPTYFIQLQHDTQIPLGRLERIPLLVHLNGHLLDRSTLPMERINTRALYIKECRDPLLLSFFQCTLHGIQMPLDLVRLARIWYALAVLLSLRSPLLDKKVRTAGKPK